jgi:hypothetical protein
MMVALDARLRRVHDPVASLLARATEAGGRLRWAGAELRVDRLARLAPADQLLFARHLAEIAERLAPPAPDGPDILAQLGVDRVELIMDAASARAVIHALPEQVGLDIETEAPDQERPWLVITKQGVLAKQQPKITDKAGLDPRRARPRTVQLYDHSTKAVFVIDLHAVPLADLAELWQRQLWIHNAGFEIAMLGAQGVHLADVVDTQMMAGLLLGCARGSRTLENVSERILAVPISKAEQLSDWAAPRLSRAQVRYAAIDAAAAYLAGQVMYASLDVQLRRCFRLQNRAVPVVAKMRLAGVPFDRATHLETIARWETELAEERERFIALTGEEPPARQRSGRGSRRACRPKRSPGCRARRPVD